MGNVNEKAIELFNEGISLSKVSEKLNISIDQVKKISQLIRMYEQIQELPQSLIDKFKALGFKALVLNPLFRDNDMEGLQEILESIDINIKRDDLKLLPEALKEKRARLEEAKKQADYRIQDLERIERETEGKIHELEMNKLAIDESLAFLDGVETDKAKEFLMEHLGVAKGRLVLFQRLDISWQQSLKQKGVIWYNNGTYTWEINDVDELTRQVERRIKNKNNMYYDPNKATGMYADYYPEDPRYKNAQGLDTSILDAVKQNEKDLKELRKKRREVNKSLKELKNTKVQTYMDAAAVSNHLSQNEILKHRQLQNSAMRYLYNEGYATATEIPKDNYRFDAVGYGEHQDLILVEAKASIEDFRADTKFNNYLKYCNRMYFIFDESMFRRYQVEIMDKIKAYDIGVLIEMKGAGSVEVEAKYNNMDVQLRNEISFLIARALSRKFIYGR